MVWPPHACTKERAEVTRCTRPPHLAGRHAAAGAARDRDFDDAVRLSLESGITSTQAMVELIDDAYYHNVIPPEMRSFIDEVANSAAERDTELRATQDHSDRFGRYRSGGLGLG